ncbi:hypothetical protein CLD20_02610 [Afifella sp. IM 167]|nr:hypothetical protein [Afifella sp. IM 167]
MLAAAALALGIGAGSAAAETDTIRIGVQAVPPDELYLARDWLEPYGLKGKITQFSSGGDMLQSFLAGQIDVANGGSARLVTVAANQPDLFYIVSTHQFGGDRYGVIVAPDAPYKTIEDLKGKKIGAVTGSGTFATFGVYLDQHGLSANDFGIVNMKVQEISTAVQQGIIDAGLAWEPHVAIAEASGRAKRIISLKGVNASPNFYLVRRDFADENPEAVAKFIASLLDLTAFVEAHPDQAGELAAGQVSKSGVEVDPKALETAFTRLSFDRKVTDDLLAELVPIAESMKNDNRIKEVPDFASLVRGEYYEKALTLSKAGQ